MTRNDCGLPVFERAVLLTLALLRGERPSILDVMEMTGVSRMSAKRDMRAMTKVLRAIQRDQIVDAWQLAKLERAPKQLRRRIAEMQERAA